MKFTISLLFLAVALTTVIAIEVDNNANYSNAAASSVVVSAVTASQTTLIVSTSSASIAPLPTEDIVTVCVTTSPTMPCTESTESSESFGNSTTTVTTHVLKTATDLVNINETSSTISTFSVPMAGSMASNTSMLSMQSIAFAPTSFAFVNSTQAGQSTVSASSPRGNVLAVSTDKYRVPNSLTDTSVDAVSVSTSTSQSSIGVYEATTAVPMPYLSTITSGSSTMIVTMTSTSTSTRIISVLMNAGYTFSVPFASAAPSQTSTCAPSTVWITVTGTKTSTIRPTPTSPGHSGTVISGTSGYGPQTRSSKTVLAGSTATSAAIYGAVSGSGLALKPSINTTNLSFSGTGIATSTSNLTGPAISPFVTPNGNNNASNSAGEGVVRVRHGNVVLTVLLMVSSAFVLAL